MYYIISKIEDTNHTGFNALGHEIHLGRFILLDMVHKGFIDTNNDIIVTNNRDRFFLYSKIFKNIICYSDFILNTCADNEIILIFPFMVSVTDLIDHYYIEQFKKKSSYPIEKILYEKMERNFDYLIKNIDYPFIDFVLINNFIMIHHRTITSKISNNNNDVNLLITNKILNTIETHYDNYDIVIFTSSKDIKFNSKKKLTYVHNLPIYASYINNEKCKLVITELSGGGESSQYFHNNNIYIYPNSYKLGNTIDSKVNLLQNNNLLHDNVNWNKHGCTNSNISIFSTIDEFFYRLNNNNIL